jgi:hypothetical protein
MSEEMDLGSREKSPESIELTPAIEVEEGRLSDASEVSQEIVGNKTPSDVEMVEKKSDQGNSQGNVDMQALMAMMQQMFQNSEEKIAQQFQQQKENHERSKVEAKQDLENIVQELKENQKQSEERLIRNCQKSQEQLAEKITIRVDKVAAEVDRVKQDLKKWERKLELEMIGVKQQFEKEREQQDVKLGQLAEIQEAENNQVKQNIEKLQEKVENQKVKMDREITSVKASVDSLQKGFEDNLSEISRRAGESTKSMEKSLKIGLQDLRKEVDQIKLKTTEKQAQVPVGQKEAVATRSMIERDTVEKSQEIDQTLESSDMELLKVTGSLGRSEFALPTFDENKGINPVAHIRQLEEFFQFRGISKRLWLIVAKRSIIGSVSKQWLEATNEKFGSYEQFKAEFLSTWWSAAQQGLVKCKLYQSKYDKTEGLSLSAHFLKYATMASYLEPKLTDCEVIEALRCHYPQEIQKLLISTKLCTIAEVLEVLKRLELMEERSSVFDVGPKSNMQQKNPQNRSGDSRYEGSGQVRQVQSYNSRGRENWRTERGRNSYRGRGYRTEQSRQEENRNYSQNRNTDRRENIREERSRVNEEN